MDTQRIIDCENAHASGATPRRPAVIVRAAGARLWDADGREYIDCAAGHGWANTGHCHPAVTRAITEQAGVLIAQTETAYNDQRASWFDELTTLLHESFGPAPTGYLNRVHACNSGAEAIEGALKLARFVTGRQGVVAMKNAFHGRTFGALSATWNRKYRDPFAPLVPGFTHVPFNDLAAAEAAVGPETAAVIVEIVQGEGGVNPGDPAYFRGLRRVCDARGALLIVDEIQTGLGRTGKWFAAEHCQAGAHAGGGVDPDILALGKSLGGGVPMGAFVWREELGTFAPGIHGSTFGANPLACAASRAALRVLREEHLVERAARLGRWLLDELRELQAPVIREVRGLGLMVGIELRSRVTPVLKGLLDRGVWALPAGPTVLRLLPPLTIAEVDLEKAVRAIYEVLTTRASR